MGETVTGETGGPAPWARRAPGATPGPLSPASLREMPDGPLADLVAGLLLPGDDRAAWAAFWASAGDDPVLCGRVADVLEDWLDDVLAFAVDHAGGFVPPGATDLPAGEFADSVAASLAAWREAGGVPPGLGAESRRAAKFARLAADALNRLDRRAGDRRVGRLTAAIRRHRAAVLASGEPPRPCDAALWALLGRPGA